MEADTTRKKPSQYFATEQPFNQPLLLALVDKLDEKVELLINAQKDGVKIAMDASEKAVAKAETASDKRFEGLNELRGMAADWRSEFARQSSVDLQIKGITDKMESIQKGMLDKIDGLQRSMWVYLIGGVTAGAAIATLVVALLRKV